MKFFHELLVSLLLLTSCLLLHGRASAEAYAIRASAIQPSTASRSSLWRSSTAMNKISVSHMIKPSRGAPTPCDVSRLDKALETSQDTRRLLVRLRSGASSEASSSSPFWSRKLLRELVAEFLGTGIIVGMGTGAVMSAIFTDSLVGLFQIASVWIIAVTIAIATMGPVSGAHLNPAISMSLAWLRPSEKFGWTKVIPYALSQTAGAVVFSGINLILYAGKIREFETANAIVRGSAESIVSAKAFGQYYLGSVTTPIAFLTEAFGSAFLAFVVFALTNPKNDTVKNNACIPPLIGMTVGGLISAFAPLTQAGFNPARDLGPRIVAWLAGWGEVSFRGWWLYIVAPVVGAPMGAWLADMVLCECKQG